MGGLNLFNINVKTLMYLKILEINIKHFWFFTKRSILFSSESASILECVCVHIYTCLKKAALV